MTARLQRELSMSKPFGSRAEEAYLNLQRTANALQQRLAETLRPYELTQTQYNVLRILRGAGEEPLTCGQVGERMDTREPDVTRLLDRLEKRSLISRSRDTRDRRVVTARITSEGLDVLSKLDQPITDLHVTQLGHIADDELDQLIDLLEQARDTASA
jgi:DNA-binding MarR family transcriptional regulator